MLFLARRFLGSLFPGMKISKASADIFFTTLVVRKFCGKTYLINLLVSQISYTIFCHSFKRCLFLTALVLACLIASTSDMISFHGTFFHQKYLSPQRPIRQTASKRQGPLVIFQCICRRCNYVEQSF